MSNLLDGLNEAQQRAVMSTAPVILCLAGAGSGKTTVLTRRMAHLHQEHRIGTANMLALTFTRLAGKEMKERVMKLVGEDQGRKLFVNTFHAFAVQVLRDWGERIGIDAGFTIYDQEDREAIMAGIIADFGGRTTLKKVLDRFEQCQDVNEEQARYPEEGRVLVEYGYRLRQNNAVDLDRLIDLVNRLWSLNPEVLQHYKSLYTHVFVDEFQDTNVEQMRLLELLHPENIFFVGDDYQAIYGWRGAKVEFIIELPDWRPDCEVIKLEDNYRSTHPIVAAANAVIAHNEHQTKKALRAQLDGDPVSVGMFPDVVTEACAVLQHVREFNESGIPLREIAVLARTNAQIARIQSLLSEVGIAAMTVSGGEDPFKSPDVKGLIAWMDVLLNRRDSVHLKRALRFPADWVTRTQLQRIELSAMQHDSSVLDAVLEAPEAEVFRYIHKRMQTRMTDGWSGTASELIELLVDELGLRELYNEQHLDNRRREVDQAYRAICRWQESRSILGEGCNANSCLKWLRYRDLQEKLIQDQQDAVRLMTVHAAKGLEFTAVIVAGMADGVFPSRRSADIEEERRLFYVALTRAKRHLVVTSPLSMEEWNGKPRAVKVSPFVAEMEVSH